MEGRVTTRGHESERSLPNYKLGKTLGIGSFAKVRLAQHVLTGHKVAVKILNRQALTDSEREKAIREIKILRQFAHPHIVRLYEVIETRSKIYVVMEYMKCGELFYHITEKGKLEEDEARFFFQQIISGVEFCHLNMVVHRDLKPENLLIDANRKIKIADFGLGNVMRDGHFLKTSCGSPNYAAPEVISSQLYAGPEVDVWSCGVILYALLCGRLPFDSDSFPELFRIIKNGVYTLPSHLSPGARDMIIRILVVDPIKRITIPQIQQHPWFCDHLPRYLAVPAINVLQVMRQIDEEILEEVTRIGFNHSTVIDALEKRLENQATVTYYLLWDNRFRVSGGYLRNEFTEASGGIYATSSSLVDHTSLIPVHNLQQQENIGHQGLFPTWQNPAVERKWAIGFQFQASPGEIMIEVLRALQKLNICWKKLGDYGIKCRWLPSSPICMTGSSSHEPNILKNSGVGTTSDNAVKFEMQLYKDKEEKYLLDLQRVNGPPLLFLEICASLLAEFWVL